MIERPPLFDFDNDPLSFNIRQYESWVTFMFSLKKELESYQRDLDEAIQLDFQIEVWEGLIAQVKESIVMTAEEIEKARKHVATLLGFNYIPRYLS